MDKANYFKPHFSEFHLPQRKHHFFCLIKEMPTGKRYYLHTSGVVLVKYKNGKERRLTGYISKGNLYVKIGTTATKVKNLVAKECFQKYKPGSHSVTIKDGDPSNCDCYNLQIYTPRQLGKKTGILAKRNFPVLVNDVQYESVRSAAKALFVSYQTLNDYLSGKSKNSVLKTQKIQLTNGGMKNE